MAIADFDGGIDTSKPTAPAATLPTSTDYDNVNKMGSTSAVQYTAPKPEPNLVQRVGEDIEKPFVQAQHTIGAGISWLGDNLKDETPFGALGDRITRAGLIMQERAQASLSKKFSNFTPNILDGIVGAAPSLAAFIGVASLGAGAATAATVGTATAIGAGVAAEDFQKLKGMGESTPEADAKAAMIGIPTGGVAALGFGIAGKLVTPWLGKMLGDTIGKIAGMSVQGGTALGAQGVVQGEAENLTGANKQTQMQIMQEAATNAVIGGVLGPASAMGHVFEWHNQVVEGFKKMGVPPKEAEQATTDMLGQASHVVMDKIENHINPTPDELSRIQATPNPKAVLPRPNILDRKSIPLDQEFPAIGTEPLPHEQVTEMSKNNEYVKLEPLDFRVFSKIDPVTKLPVVDTKLTSADMRLKVWGGRTQQLNRGAYLQQDMIAQSPEEMGAAFWKENHSLEELKLAKSNPEGFIRLKGQEFLDEHGVKEKFDPSKEDLAAAKTELESHLPDIEKALSLSEGGEIARGMYQRFVKENGQVATALGTIEKALDDYRTNRLYKPDKEDQNVRIEGKSGLKTFSFHRLQRVYKDPGQAIAFNKRLATTNLADLAAIFNQDTTMVNYGRQWEQELSNMPGTPLGDRVNVKNIPAGWKAYEGTQQEKPFQDKDGNLGIDRTVFASPKGIHQGMKPLVEPDWWRSKFSWVAPLQDVQAFIKTSWLGLSGYHDTTFLTTTLASAGGIKTLADLPKALLDGTMEKPAFREEEQEWTKAGMTTSTSTAVQDIRSGLEEKGENWEKFLKAPIVKQVNGFSEAHAKFLFGPYQRWIKVRTASNEFANWMGSHPSASEAEIEAAKQSIAKATNDTFGGRNWDVLGYSKAKQSLLRTFILAPDWVFSMLGYTKSLGGGIIPGVKGGAGSAMNRGNLALALGAGYAFGDGLNYLLTGHHMKDNPKGHQFAVQLGKDVYFDPIRGMAGELVKLYDDVVDSGGLEGAQRYFEYKGSAITSSAIMAITGRDPMGNSIWKGSNPVMKSIDGLWAMISHNLPIPFNFSGAAKYLIPSFNAGPFNYRGNDNPKSAGEAIAIGTGEARYSPQSDTMKTHDMNQSVIQAYRNGNEQYVNGLIDKGDLSQEEADHLKDESMKSDLELKTQHMKIDKVIELYNHSSPDDRKQIRDTLEDKFDRYMGSSASPNAKKKVQKLYDNMAKE